MWLQKPVIKILHKSHLKNMEQVKSPDILFWKIAYNGTGDKLEFRRIYMIGLFQKINLMNFLIIYQRVVFRKLRR